jgi:guanylate kinase
MSEAGSPDQPLGSWELPSPGVLFVISGPSGVGKSTLVQSAMRRIPGLGFSISATTRSPRPGELDGREYHFVTPERFEEWVARDAFLEHATVYDQRYGTPIEPVLDALNSGRSLVLDIDVQGSAYVRQRLPEAVHIFVLPRSVEVLEQRLRARGESETTVTRRMAQAAQQLRGCPSYDYVVVNDELETANAVLQGILLAEMSRTARRLALVDRVCGSL